MTVRTHRRPICPPGGAGALAPWTKIVATDQGVAPIDTAAQTTAGTGFTAATGRFRIVYPTGLTTLLDGYREALPRWSINLLTLIPDFNHLTDIIDLCQVIVSLPLSATVEKFFMWHGIFNENIAGLAIQSGQAFGIKPNTSTQWNHGPVNETSDAMGNVLTAGTPNKLLSRHFAGGSIIDSGFDWISHGRALSGTAWEGSDSQGSPVAMDIASHPLVDWTIQTGGGHDTTTGTAGADHEWELWYRRIKTSGFTGLP